MAYLWVPYYLDTDGAAAPNGYAVYTSIEATPVVPVATAITRRASPVPEEVQPIGGGGSATQGYATGG